MTGPESVSVYSKSFDMIKQALLNNKILKFRHLGNKGTRIPMHRSMRRTKLSWLTIISIILLPVFFDVMIWNYLGVITDLWADILNFCMNKLGLNGQISYSTQEFFGKTIYIPFPDLPISLPLERSIWLNIIVSLSILLLSVFIPKNYLPAAYILRAILIIQISASVYFMINPETTPYNMQNYISGMLLLGIYLIFIIAPVLALIYYIFNFSLWQKLILTLMTIAYFILLLPFQYMLHAVIISSGSLLFMPVLYLFFGPLLDTLLFVGFYSWAMSWSSKRNGKESDDFIL